MDKKTINPTVNKLFYAVNKVLVDNELDLTCKIEGIVKKSIKKIVKRISI